MAASILPPPVAASDGFLRDVKTIIHIGANEGQERRLYSYMNLTVLWVEPDPKVFLLLTRNISSLKRQSALEYLLADKDDELVPFHISNNGGLSSSILDLNDHRELWPDVGFESTTYLKSYTLDTMLSREGYSDLRVDALVLDTQGSELLILRGATRTLASVKYIKVEAPDFEAYKGCCQVRDLGEFLRRYGFLELSRTAFAQKVGVGTYYDIVYKREGALAR